MNNILPEISARLKVLSEFVVIPEFFIENNIPYTTAWNKGDEIITPNGFHTGKYKTEFGVILNSSIDYTSVDQHVVNLLEIINPYKDVLQSLSLTDGVNFIFCIGITMVDSNPLGISLDDHIIQQMAQLNMSLDVDLIY